MYTVVSALVLVAFLWLVRDGDATWKATKEISSWYTPVVVITTVALVASAFAYLIVAIDARDAVWPLTALFTDWPGCSSAAATAIRPWAYACFFF